MNITSLTIAGSDSCAGAGIQADLRTFDALGVYGLSVITTLTAQNTQRIRSIEAIKPSMVRAQIEALLSDIKIDAIKIGMVYNNGIIDAIADSLKGVKIPIVLDPIFKASTGAILLKPSAYNTYIKRLIPLATIITPNADEASILSNMRVKGIEEARIAIKKIADLGVKSVVIKGGHMREVIDLLYHNNKTYEFRNERVRKKFHGAGSIFSAALTANLAKGHDLVNAVRLSNLFVKYAILNSEKIGKGLEIPLHTKYAERSMLKLQQAIDMLENMNDLSSIIPESQSNIVYAKADARSLSDIMGIRGRIVKMKGKVRAGYVEFGASKHVASAVLAMMKYDKSIRSAMNIKYDEDIIKSCMGRMRVSYYDRREEPEDVKSKEGMSIRWGIEQAIARSKEIPDLVYHLGDWGKEPMILIFGRDPMDVVEKVRMILIFKKRYT